jgi:hypothetical protein
MEEIHYKTTFSQPVVLGQVMSYNDSRWSVFWCDGGTRTNPPDSSSLFVGKNVAEDFDTNRLAETIGYVIVEEGMGTLHQNNGEILSYSCALGEDSITSISDNSYYDLFESYSAGVACLNAIDGGNGGWAVMLGQNPLSNNRIYLGIDEDIIRDSERSHTNEQVAYWVFSSEGNITSDKQKQDGAASEWSLFSTDTDSPWLWTFPFPRGPGFYEFYSVASMNGFIEETLESKDALCSYGLS